jgi:hypothetical protein
MLICASFPISKVSLFRVFKSPVYNVRCGRLLSTNLQSAGPLRRLRSLPSPGDFARDSNVTEHELESLQTVAEADDWLPFAGHAHSLSRCNGDVTLVDPGLERQGNESI